MGEELIRDFDSAVNDYFEQIMKLANTNFGIFGHSMGAILMLKLVERIENVGKIPFCVFVSGNPGPQVLEKRERHRLSQVDFKEELTRYGGMPRGVLEDEEIYDFFEPVLRADFEVVETSYDAVQPVISSPIVALMGREEQGVEKIETWRFHTRGKFKCMSYPGGHFFIYESAKAISELISYCYDNEI